MIRPKPKPSTAPVKAGAILLTGLILVGAQTGLQGLALPAFGSGRDLIRELDPLVFERFAAPPPPPAASEEVTDEAPEPVAEETSVSFEQEVGQAMQQLEELFGADEAAPTVVDRTGQGEAAAPGITAEATDDRFESLFGGNDGGVVVGRAGRGRNTAVREGAGGLGIGINETLVSDSAVRERGSAPVGPDVAVSTGATRTETETVDVAIAEFSSESFDGSEADRLALWMRSNPGELPVGVRVHVNFEPTFLTSTATFRDEGRTWELFLMFNESLRELHLVLVEADRSVYLIDRGFQEESRSLREGTVRRTGGSIVAVDSRSGAPSGERARDFYNVFLSWWEATKADARTP